MKNGKIHGKFGFLIGLAVAGALLFAACQVDPPSSEPEEGYGRVIVTIGEDGEERTALPSDPTLTTYTKYVYTFTDTSNNTRVFTAVPAGGTFTLPKGTYTLTVKAYSSFSSGDDDYAAVGSSTAPFTVGTGAPTKITIKLATVENGTGTFEYTIDYPVGASVTLSLVRYGTNGNENVTEEVQGYAAAITSPDDASLERITKLTAPIKVGYYLFTVRIIKDGGTTISVGGISEVVHIYKDLNTPYKASLFASDLSPMTDASEAITLLEEEIESWVKAPTLAAPRVKTQFTVGTAPSTTTEKVIILYFSVKPEVGGVQDAFPISLQGGWRIKVGNTPADWLGSNYSLSTPTVYHLDNSAFAPGEADYTVVLYPVVQYNVSFGDTAVTTGNVRISGNQRRLKEADASWTSPWITQPTTHTVTKPGGSYWLDVGANDFAISGNNDVIFVAANGATTPQTTLSENAPSGSFTDTNSEVAKQDVKVVRAITKQKADALAVIGRLDPRALGWFPKTNFASYWEAKAGSGSNYTSGPDDGTNLYFVGDAPDSDPDKKEIIIPNTIGGIKGWSTRDTFYWASGDTGLDAANEVFNGSFLTKIILYFTPDGIAPDFDPTAPDATRMLYDIDLYPVARYRVLFAGGTQVGNQVEIGGAAGTAGNDIIKKDTAYPAEGVQKIHLVQPTTFTLTKGSIDPSPAGEKLCFTIQGPGYTGREFKDVSSGSVSLTPPQSADYTITIWPSAEGQWDVAKKEMAEKGYEFLTGLFKLPNDVEFDYRWQKSGAPTSVGGVIVQDGTGDPTVSVLYTVGTNISTITMADHVPLTGLTDDSRWYKAASITTPHGPNNRSVTLNFRPYGTDQTSSNALGYNYTIELVAVARFNVKFGLESVVANYYPVYTKALTIDYVSSYSGAAIPDYFPVPRPLTTPNATTWPNQNKNSFIRQLDVNTRFVTENDDAGVPFLVTYRTFADRDATSPVPETPYNDNSGAGFSPSSADYEVIIYPSAEAQWKLAKAEIDKRTDIKSWFTGVNFANYWQSNRPGGNVGLGAKDVILYYIGTALTSSVKNNFALPKLIKDDTRWQAHDFVHYIDAGSGIDFDSIQIPFLPYGYVDASTPGDPYKSFVIDLVQVANFKVEFASGLAKDASVKVDISGLEINNLPNTDFSQIFETATGDEKIISSVNLFTVSWDNSGVITYLTYEADGSVKASIDPDDSKEYTITVYDTAENIVKALEKELEDWSKANVDKLACTPYYKESGPDESSLYYVLDSRVLVSNIQTSPFLTIPTSLVQVSTWPTAAQRVGGWRLSSGDDWDLSGFATATSDTAPSSTVTLEFLLPGLDPSVIDPSTDYPKVGYTVNLTPVAEYQVSYGMGASGSVTIPAASLLPAAVSAKVFTSNGRCIGEVDTATAIVLTYNKNDVVVAVSGADSITESTTTTTTATITSPESQVYQIMLMPKPKF